MQTTEVRDESGKLVKFMTEREGITIGWDMCVREKCKAHVSLCLCKLGPLAPRRVSEG